MIVRYEIHFLYKNQQSFDDAECSYSRCWVFLFFWGFVASKFSYFVHIFYEIFLPVNLFQPSVALFYPPENIRSAFRFSDVFRGGGGIARLPTQEKKRLKKLGNFKKIPEMPLMAGTQPTTHSDYRRLKLSPTTGRCPQWLLFFKKMCFIKIIVKRLCMSIGGGQINSFMTEALII